MGWVSDKAWSDRFIPTIRSIVGPQLLVVAPLEVDQKQATDLIVLRARDMMIAARVRRCGYADRYPYEFTIRSARDSGAKTELEKIVNGFGDWMFYGHAADESTAAMLRWMVVDLHAWRAHLIRNREGIVKENRSNRDGTHFVAFDVRSFVGDPPIMIACSHPLEKRSPPQANVEPEQDDWLRDFTAAERKYERDAGGSAASSGQQ